MWFRNVFEKKTDMQSLHGQNTHICESREARTGACSFSNGDAGTYPGSISYVHWGQTRQLTDDFSNVPKYVRLNFTELLLSKVWYPCCNSRNPSKKAQLPLDFPERTCAHLGSPLFPSTRSPLNMTPPHCRCNQGKYHVNFMVESVWLRLADTGCWRLPGKYWARVIFSTNLFRLGLSITSWWVKPFLHRNTPSKIFSYNGLPRSESCFNSTFSLLSSAKVYTSKYSSLKRTSVAAYSRAVRPLQFWNDHRCSQQSCANLSRPRMHGFLTTFHPDFLHIEYSILSYPVSSLSTCSVRSSTYIRHIWHLWKKLLVLD